MQLQASRDEVNIVHCIVDCETKKMVVLVTSVYIGRFQCIMPKVFY